MAKALVLSGTDFSTNKLTTVNFTESVPCTGLSLSQNSISNTDYFGTVQLTATKTPANTTDTLSWSSSDETVATVSNGFVTFVGIGSATITATCGQQTATCSCTSAISVNGSTFAVFNGYQLTTTDLTLDPPKDCSGVYPYYKDRIYASLTPTDYLAFTGSGYTEITSVAYPIMLPKNVTKIEVSVPSEFSQDARIVFFDSKELETYNSTGTTLVVQYDTGVTKVNNKYTFTVTADDADSFAFNLRTGSADASEVTGTVTVTFLAA